MKRVHTLARERVDDLFLDTLLTLGQSLVLCDKAMSDLVFVA